MSKFDINKLYVNYREFVTPISPIGNRKYTLTHSDVTAELFLTIGLEYAYDEITAMRDEVLGQWEDEFGKYILNIFLYVDGNFGPTASVIRDSIFRKELPLALKAIRYGDRYLFGAYPELDTAPIIVYFNSSLPQFNKIENWGTFSQYKIYDI